VERNYLEVETPVRLPTLVPEAHIIPIHSGNMFLQTSPELCMKRLLARGVPKIFQICKCFRKGELGRLHLEEFTMLEWYSAGSDYLGLMDECEALFAFLAESLQLAGNKLTYSGLTVDLATPWERLTVDEAFHRYAPMTLAESLDNDQFEQVLVEHVEPHLGRYRPTFLVDYPAVLGALARLKDTDNTVAERVELYVAGLELANGFSELTDVEEQRRRFDIERGMIRAVGRDPGVVPEKFLDDLPRIAKAAGIAMGLDRLLMLFFNVPTIDDVLAFGPDDL